MRNAIRPALVLTALVLLVRPLPAHFHMLLPEPASAQRGKPVTILFQWGHPFEHQLFDAPAPQSVVVLAPDGRRTDLTKSLEKITVPAGEKKAAAYRLRFTPEQRGDFVVVLNSRPVWMEEEKEFYQDTVKVILHVQSQQGWDAAAGQEVEMVPLTRPYGLRPGMVFQAQALVRAEGAIPTEAAAVKQKPLAGVLVEVERFNPAPPKELPPDEQITRTVKTDPNGVATCTLTEPGWWCLTAQTDGGRLRHEGKPYPLRRRATLWVFVGEKGTASPRK
jgi:uncharacterized GH25 family protein